MAKRELSVKFDTEGFNQAISELQRVGKAFDVALSSAQDAVKAAQREISAAGRNGNAQQMAKAQKDLEKNTRAVNRAIAQSYKELGIKSSESLNRLRAQAVSAFEAIKNSGTATANDVGRAQVALNKKLEALENQFRETSKEVERSGARFNSFGNILKNQIFSDLSSTLIALPSIIQQATQSFASFDDQIRAFMAVSGATAEEVKLIREEIELLGASTSKTPQEIAALSTELSRAGFTAQEVQTALAGIVKAAEATNEDLSGVGKTIGSTLKAFGIDPSESGRVADLLVQTANNSSVSITELGESLKYVGTVAGQYNQSLEDVLAVLGLMGDVALRGGQAGRNFAQTLEKLALTSAGATDELIVTSRGMEKSADAIEALGVSFRDSNQQVRPFMEILPELKVAMDKLSEPDKDVITRVLFGVQGSRAVRTTLRTTKEDIDFLVEAIQNAAGTAERTSEIMNAGLGGALRNLTSNFEVLRNKIGDEFQPTTTKAIRAVSGVITLLTENIDALLVVMAGLTSAGVSGVVIATINSLIVAVKALVVAFVAAESKGMFFQTALSSLVSPANLAAGSIGLLVAGLVKFQLEAKRSQERALALGQTLERLSNQANESALIKVDEEEANARGRLSGIDQQLARNRATLRGFQGWEWLPGTNNSVKKLQEEIRRLEAERNDINQDLLRVNTTRERIRSNIQRSRQFGPEMPDNFGRTNPDGSVEFAAPSRPTSTREQTRTQSTRTSARQPRPKRYYEFTPARPTKGPVTSPYGMRTHPIHGGRRMHHGIDYGAPTGTPVIAPLPGRVTFTGYQRGGAGNYIKTETIDKQGRKLTQIFMHLSKILVGVGETIKQGDILGRVGSTGGSTGPHLDWRTQINGKYINPARFRRMRFSISSDQGKPSQYLRKEDQQQQRAATQAARNQERQRRRLQREAEQRQKAEERAAEQERLQVIRERQLRIEDVRTAIVQEGERKRSELVQESEQKGYELKMEQLKAEDEYSKKRVENQAIQFRIESQAQLRLLDLTTERNAVEQEIRILQEDRNILTDDEVKRLSELLYEKEKLGRVEESINKEKERGLTLAKAQIALERQQRLAEFRQGVGALSSSVGALSLTPQQAAVSQSLAPINDLQNNLLGQIKTGQGLGDQQSLATLEKLYKETELSRQRILDDQIQAIQHQTRLNELVGDELAKYEQLTAVQQEFDDRRATVEALLSEARASGYEQQINLLNQLLEKTEVLRQEQIKQVEDQFNILKQSFETVKESMSSALETFFYGMFTNFDSLGGLINSLFTSILKSIAQVAAQNVTRSIFKGIGWGFADGGLVTGRGTGRSDSIPARLSNGEFVMNADSVKYWGVNFLNDLNSRRSPELSINSSRAGRSGMGRDAIVVMNVSTPDANSFRNSESQLGRQAGEQLRRNVQRNS